MKPETVAIAALVLLVAALGLNMCAITAPHQRPQRIILVEGTTPSVDAGGDCIVYRYFVDGTESFAVLRDVDEVAAFTRYLKRVGRVTTMREFHGRVAE